MQFSQRRGQTALLALVATIAAAATAPSAANAVTVTVTGDDGNPVALGGAINIRNMSPHVIATAAAGEFYKYTVTGPNGGQVAVPASACYRASDGPEDRLVDYVGNGAYTVNLLEYGATDQFCQNPPIRQTPLPFSITASVSLAAPPGPVLTRKPGSFVTNTAILPIDLNPGALSNDAFVALNGQVGPDGALLGTPTELFPDSNTRTVAVGLDKGPGNYVVVARATSFTGSAGQFFTPWSAPVSIRAFAPFDFKSVTFPDRRGPSYRVRATMNEKATSGQVSIAIARGSKGGRYRSLGSVKIRGQAISKRFRLTRSGTYRLRFKYKGNALVAPGFAVERIRITRRSSFRTASVVG